VILLFSALGSGFAKQAILTAATLVLGMYLLIQGVICLLRAINIGKNWSLWNWVVQFLKKPIHRMVATMSFAGLTAYVSQVVGFTMSVSQSNDRILRSFKSGILNYSEIDWVLGGIIVVGIYILWVIFRDPWFQSSSSSKKKKI